MLLRNQNIQDSTRLVHLELNELTKDFRKRLQILVEKSKSIAPLVVVATFSHKYRWEQSPEDRRRVAQGAIYFMPWMNVKLLLQAYGYNNVIKEVAKETS